jgi:hypothetical protein
MDIHRLHLVGPLCFGLSGVHDSTWSLLSNWQSSTGDESRFLHHAEIIENCIVNIKFIFGTVEDSYMNQEGSVGSH